jgi:hypothetical protein
MISQPLHFVFAVVAPMPALDGRFHRRRGRPDPRARLLK